MSKGKRIRRAAGKLAKKGGKKAVRLLWGNTKEKGYLRAGLRGHRVRERLTKL